MGRFSTECGKCGSKNHARSDRRRWRNPMSTACAERRSDYSVQRMVRYATHPEIPPLGGSR